MMVHPSRLTNAQNIFYNWIKDVCEGWKRLLQSNDEDEKRELLREFREAYNDLRLSVGNPLPSFADLAGSRLIHNQKHESNGNQRKQRKDSCNSLE